VTAGGAATRRAEATWRQWLVGGVLEGGDPADVVRQVKDVLRAKFHTTWKDHQLGLFDLRCTALPRGALLRERKLRRLVDERERD
jgi:hypothetical protein